MHEEYTWKFDGFFKGVECEFEVSGPDSSYTAQLIIMGKYGDDAIINSKSARLAIKLSSKT